MALGTGDIALMARGCTHFVSTSASIDNLPRMTIPPAQSGFAPAISADDNAANIVFSGAYQLWHEPVHPLFALLPAWYVLRAETATASAPLKQAIALLEAEMCERSLGTDMVVHGLLDVIFTYALRQMVEVTAPKQSNWAVGIRDASVRQAVQLMHDDCGREWTLGGLASAVGVSRTGLAAKFRETMGDTPLNYLRSVRIQNAMRILSETQKTLETVAIEVGYQDAFSFSKVFKRTVGISPREFRRKDVVDQSAEWRFDGAVAGAGASQR
jgi:AraC-like DNA-binding protein